MTAIETRYLGPTNCRGSRVKAVATGSRMIGHPDIQITLGWDDALDSEQNHRAAAEALARRQGWHGRWIGGGTDRGYVFVCDVKWETGFTVPETAESLNYR